MPSSLNSVYAHPHCRYINLQWGYVHSKNSNMENKVIRAITFKEDAFCTLLTYKDAYIVNGTLTVIAGKDIVDGFIYWDSTPTVEVNNICYFSIGK